MPATTISYNVAPGYSLDATVVAIEKAIAELNPPGGLRAEFAGDVADFRKVAAGMAGLILAALLSVYIILGILYESLIHPITIISTLPSAGLGALLSLEAFGVEFTIIAFIGILLLIGIVKKNGIMLVDFALQAERDGGMSVHDAALAAARSISPDSDDDACRDFRRAAARLRNRDRRRTPASARHHHRRRIAAQPGADARHDAGDDLLMSRLRRKKPVPARQRITPRKAHGA